MIAIHTKYLSATNTQGSRIKAYTASYGSQKGLSVTIPYDYSLDGVAVHFKAVKALFAKHGEHWPSSDNMCYGDSADGRGFSFCFGLSKVQQ